FGARTADGEGPWLRTGDLGAVQDGELYVTGRAKDVVIVRGRNLWPEDLELAVEAAHPAIRGGCSAVFGVEVGGEEQVAVACEVAARLDERLDRPLHASVLFNVPTISRLAAWLVEGGSTAAKGVAAPETLYPDLATALARLDARNPDAYRFDLQRDIAWERA